MSDDSGTVTGDDELRAALQRLVRQLVHEEPAEKLRGDDLAAILDAHLGTPADEVPVVVEAIGAHRWADTDIALESLAARDPDARLLGVGGGEQRHHSSLGDMLSNARRGRFRTGQVDRLRVAVGPDAERSTVAFGIHLLRHDGSPLAVLQRMGSREYGSEPRLELLAADSDTAEAFLAELREEAMRRSVLRGQVIGFSGDRYKRSMSGLTFHRRPDLPAQSVVLPDGILDQVRGHVLGLAEHRDRLRAQGQHLKRGVLLYGPPGTGKTHTLRHLISEAADATVVLLTGSELAYVSHAAQIARAHQPAVIVIEDCDLIAEDRDYGEGSSPLLFTLLDVMDGLDQDADVVFLLTTNRAEALERALAQRPGRVDLAVEIPLPSEQGRRALVELYSRDVDGFSDEAIDRAARESAGTTASYARELVRRAVLRAATQGHDCGDDDLAAANADLQAGAARLTRSLLGSPAERTAEPDLYDE